MEDTGEEPFVRNEYPTEKLHEDFKQLMQDTLMKAILEKKKRNIGEKKRNWNVGDHKERKRNPRTMEWDKNLCWEKFRC